MQVISENGKRKWRVVRPLGKGGCGEVYLVEEVMTGAVKRPISSLPMALKVVKVYIPTLVGLPSIQDLGEGSFSWGD